VGNGPFRGLGAVFYKELLHMRRDKVAISFALLLPLLQMIVLGFAIDTNIRNVRTVVFNQDNTLASRELLDRFRNSDTFSIVAFVQSDNELNNWIISGRARVGLKIPVDYADEITRRGSAQVLVLIDGSDSTVAGTALNVSTAIGPPKARLCRHRSTTAADPRLPGPSSTVVDLGRDSMS
jgi:ABC-2 type transport system permease protein